MQQQSTRTTFAVGRLTRQSAQILIAEGSRSRARRTSPIRLKSREDRSVPETGRSRIH